MPLSISADERSVASTQSCIVIDGLEMLINQGVVGVKHWTGVDADPGVMRKKLEEIFGG